MTLTRLTGTIRQFWEGEKVRQNMRDIIKARKWPRRQDLKAKKNSSNSKSFSLFGKKIKVKYIWRFIQISAAVVVFGSAGLFAWYSKDLPTPGKIRQRQAIESTKILDRNNNLLYEIHGEEKRTVLKTEDIPEIMKQATLTAEDRNFYNHIGIDFKGLARSVLKNAFEGSRVGGSTITQQFVKNAILTNQKTIDRKIKELILSLELEAMFDKDEILTFYLNDIPYGSNNYGVESAAKDFFDKDAIDLELHEAALLAALPQLPTYYSPYGTHTDDLKERRDWILNSMAELGYITQQEANEAIAQDLGVTPQDESSIKAPHFVFYVKEQLVEMFDEQTVEEGGLIVHTSLDPDLQAKAEEAVRSGIDRIKSRGGSNAAIASVNPDNGEILAMVGSVDYFDSENDGNVNVTVSERQPGSSFKPIVYAAGFKEGHNYNPATTLWDVPTTFDGNYKPKNYDGSFRGPVSVRYSITRSLNIPAVKMLGLVGLEDALDTAHEMGITTLNDPERYGLSLVLGGGEVKPLDMATAYATFANGGTHRPATSITKVENSAGNVLFEHTEGTDEKDVLPREIAYEMTSILSGNSTRESSFNALYFPTHQVAAKTGTTNEYRDAWTVGYSRGLATAVWVGNNDNSPMSNAPGATVAAPIFQNYMENALAGMEVREFEKPDTIKTVTVDKLSNKLPTDSSPETVTDIFAPWQIPNEKDDIHVKVKVNKINGKLATDLTPSELIEEKVFTIIHSEMPDKPNWEQPVIAWAESHEIVTGEPPTEEDDMYNEGNLPQVKITSPNNGETVTGNFKFTATASAEFGIRQVEFKVDNALVKNDITKPYEASAKASDFSPGEHTLKVNVIDNNGALVSAELTFSVESDSTAPSPVTDVSAQSLDQAVRLSWTNPSDEDLERVKIYLSTSPGSLGTLYPTEPLVNPDSSSNFTVTGLTNSTTYYFTLRPVDSSGNIKKDTSQVSATPSS